MSLPARKRQKPPTAFEREVLAVLLVELRRAMRMQGQLSITIDPWANGAEVFASPNTVGRSYSIARRGR